MKTQILFSVLLLGLVFLAVNASESEFYYFMICFLLTFKFNLKPQACKENEVFRSGSPCEEHCPSYNVRGEVETVPLMCNRMLKTGIIYTNLIE